MHAKDIKDLSLAELKQALADINFPPYRAKQIFAWIYKKGASSFEAMSDLPQDLRKRLEQEFCFSNLKLVKALLSRDGTEKLLFELEGKNIIEAVSIPAQDRVTGCISTQVGCKFACRFCASGLLGFKRNLSAGEIIEQALYLKNKAKTAKLTHLVFMGTGEPLDNYDNLLKAIRIINSADGLNIGARRITISTSGVIPGIERLAKEGLQIELSVSLHSADNKMRTRIMPINKKYPLKNLITACRDYIKKTNRQVTFEYCLVKGLNSDLLSAQKLAIILKRLNAKVNLIPANPVKELGIEPPDKLGILKFQAILSKAGINVTLRRPRGQDIDAACGQLRYRYEEKH